MLLLSPIKHFKVNKKQRLSNTYLLLHFLIQIAKGEPWNPRISQDFILKVIFWDLSLVRTYPTELWKPRRMIHNLFG